MSLRTELYHILETSEIDHPLEQPVRIALGSLIVLNLLAAILETVPELSAYHPGLELFERASIVVFLFEYMARVWVCTEKVGRSSIVGRIRFMLRPMMLIDLSVILISLAPAFFDMRAFRTLRLARLLKFGRYSRAVRLIIGVLESKRDEFVSCFILAMLVLVISSSLMYYAEHRVQPEAFASIPTTMWWGVATLTTVGYGDVAPVTPLGKFIGALVAMSAIGVFGLPSGVLASGFIEELSRAKNAVPSQEESELVRRREEEDELS